MARCWHCQYAKHEQFEGYEGRWYCLHPYRSELDNRGKWTYPRNPEPQVKICDTPVEAYGDRAKALTVLNAAATPKWCYKEAVARAKVEEPDFDPNLQRKILYDTEDD